MKVRLKVGDVVRIEARNDASKNGVGVYLGRGARGDDRMAQYHAFLWKGRVATFIPMYWKFEVLT